MTKQVKAFFSKPDEPSHLDALSKYFAHTRRGSNVFVSLSRGDEIYARMKASCPGAVHDNYFWEQHRTSVRIHNKCFAFESLDYSHRWLQHDVVAVTTGNINSNTKNKHECLVRFQSKLLCDAFKLRWKEIQDHMGRGTAAPGWTAKSEGYDESNPELKVKVYFFPRTGGGDTFVDILNNVDKTKPGSIRLLMPRFRRTRKRIATKLREIADGGQVEVSVITRPRDSGVNFDLAGKLGTKVKYRVLKIGGPYYFHSRYLTVDATYLGTGQKIAWMGTPNLSQPALDSVHETLLKIRDVDHEIHDACVANFGEVLWPIARHPDSRGHWPEA